MKYFILSLILSTATFANALHCPMVESISCEKLIMDNLNPRDYDDANEYLEIRRACFGNDEDKCLAYVLPYLSRFERDDRHELVSLAGHCQLTNLSCVEYIRKQLSTFQFDDLREINQITLACTRSDVSCIERLCNTRQYNCRNEVNLMQAARACYNPCGN